MLRSVARSMRDHTRALMLRGNRYHCPLCNNSYSKLINDRVCPGCKSCERHRILWLYLLHLQEQRKIRLEGKLLHVAPESCLEKRFRNIFDYLSVDLEEGRAMKVADVTNLDFEDDFFEVVVCNHVLEHIDDDHKAISELRRVLKPGGYASLQVPMTTDRPTDEDRSVVDPKERLRRFGQEDHVRLYGYDYFNRLQKVGFEVDAGTWEKFLTRETAEKYGVMNDPVIIARKL